VSRIAPAFAALRARGEAALVPYFTAGDPDLDTTRELVLAAFAEGADAVEIGVPFSDPMADGPVLQRSAARALAAGTTLPRVLELVAKPPQDLELVEDPVGGLDELARLRRRVDVPMAADACVRSVDDARRLATLHAADAVVLKVLGATRGAIAAAFLIEHGILGLVTALVAAALGTLAAFELVTGPMRSEWMFLPGPLVAILGLAVVLTLAFGFAGTWRALGARPAAYLRNE